MGRLGGALSCRPRNTPEPGAPTSFQDVLRPRNRPGCHQCAACQQRPGHPHATGIRANVHSRTQPRAARLGWWGGSAASGLSAVGRVQYAATIVLGDDGEAVGGAFKLLKELVVKIGLSLKRRLHLKHLSAHTYNIEDREDHAQHASSSSGAIAKGQTHFRQPRKCVRTAATRTGAQQREPAGGSALVCNMR